MDISTSKELSEHLVSQSNRVIEARYDLDKNAQRLLFACISKIDSRPDSDFDVTQGYILTVEEAKKLYYKDTDAKNVYRDLKKATNELYEARIHLKSADGRFERKTRWVSACDYDNKKNQVVLYFSPQIVPYLTDLKNNFTSYKLRYITELKLRYSIRIYQLILSWYGRNDKYKKMEIIDFKTMLELDGKYAKHTDFNNRVIKPAVKEINEFTDFELKVELTKRGRAYRFIELWFNPKESENIKDVNPTPLLQMTAKQIPMFAYKLAEDEIFNTQKFKANTGEAMKDYVYRVHKALENEENQQAWYEDLIRVGFNPLSC